ncbi:hypothetical protein ABBQ32_003457 [Trebouxia sp. C0010 RCD-2024]
MSRAGDKMVDTRISKERMRNPQDVCRSFSNSRKAQAVEVPHAGTGRQGESIDPGNLADLLPQAASGHTVFPL